MTTPTVVLQATDIVKDLGVGAGMVRALKGVSLSLCAGELTLLMGPSGSGKTTLLSILGCILSPTEGEVTIANESLRGLGPEGLAELRRRHIGFVFQSYNLFPTLNAMENVRLALDVRGMAGPEAHMRAEKALRDVGLGHRLRNYPRHLSGGEQQRVAVARALAGTPSVILADERERPISDGTAVRDRQRQEPRRAGRHPRQPHYPVCRPDHPHRRRTDRRRGAPHRNA
jgi:putative ABC transport system ATP-binding protein